jgi:predicted 3-demethylubiquinone-9 3-methyltransferase (glyoxalase superfamily)
LFAGGAISDVIRYGPGEPGPEGSIKKAAFTIGGQTVLCTDSFVKHDFTFTPAFSFFVDCDSEDEVRRLTAALSENGATFMPRAAYGFSRLFAWVSDRYGVCWQLNLP